MKNTNKYEPADQSHVFTSFPVTHNDEEDMQVVRKLAIY